MKVLSVKSTIVMPEECLGYGLVVPFLVASSAFGFEYNEQPKQLATIFPPKERAQLQ